MEILTGILVLVWAIALLILYHTVFEVYYFNASVGLLKELIGAFILGIIMTALTLYFWWLTAIIVILVGLANMGKTGNKMHLIISIVIAVIIAILGIVVV